MFGFLTYIVLGVVFVLALGVFFYNQYLTKTLAAKEAELAKAQKSIDEETVRGFVQLRDRLNAGKTLLTNHVAFSGFFKLLETLLPATVRFSSLNLTLDDTKKVRLGGSGTAKNFNALANISTAFAKDSHIKDAIFSNIGINKDGSVSFVLSATLDPKVIAFSL